MKESEIHSLEKKINRKRPQEDLDVGMSRKGFNTTIINMFEDLKEEVDIMREHLSRDMENILKMGFIKQISTISEMKISPYKVNRRLKSAEKTLNLKNQ